MWKQKGAPGRPDVPDGKSDLGLIVSDYPALATIVNVYRNKDPASFVRAQLTRVPGAPRAQ